VPQGQFPRDEGQHRDTQPNGKFHTLMIHKKPPGLPWLVRSRARPPKQMIVGAAVANITKIDDFVRINEDRYSGVFRRFRRSPMVFDDLALRIVSPSHLRLLTSEM
jgi:hypothetical protein